MRINVVNHMLLQQVPFYYSGDNLGLELVEITLKNLGKTLEVVTKAGFTL